MTLLFSLYIFVWPNVPSVFAIIPVHTSVKSILALVFSVRQNEKCNIMGVNLLHFNIMVMQVAHLSYQNHGKE